MFVCLQTNISKKCSLLCMQLRDSADVERTVRGGDVGGATLPKATGVESPFYLWSCKLFRVPSLPPLSDEENERSALFRPLKDKVETRKKMVRFRVFRRVTAISAT